MTSTILPSCDDYVWDHDVFPAPKQEAITPIGFWYYHNTSSDRKEERVYNIREDNNILEYLSIQVNNKQQSYSKQNKYYYDKCNGFIIFYYTQKIQNEEWRWELYKILEHNKNSISLAFVTDEGFHLYGPFNVEDCMSITEFYKDRAYPYSDVITFKRISQDEFIRWWNSVS